MGGKLKEKHSICPIDDSSMGRKGKQAKDKLTGRGGVCQQREVCNCI